MALSYRHVVGCGATVAVTASCPRAHAGASAYARVWTVWSGNTATLCAEGCVDVDTTRVGEWTYTLVGARSNGTTVAPEPRVVDGPLFSTTCQDIPDEGVPSGSFTANLTYAGAGTVDQSAHAFLVAEWSTVTGPQEVATGTG